jgi:ABC-type transport system involved in cytochrome c biogenesis permease subunit
MTLELIIGSSAAALYLTAAILAVVSVARTTALTRLTAQALPGSAALGALCLGAGLVLHGRRLGMFPAFGAFEAASWYALAVTASYLYVSQRQDIRSLAAFLFPYQAVLVLLGLLQIAAVPAIPVGLRTPMLGLHVATAFAGYGLFTIESVVAAAYLLQDHNLKRREFGLLYRKLPALETLDRVMFDLIGPAFFLFSISIAMGVVLAHVNKWGVRWTTDPKVLATGFTWVVYGMLFHLRRSADRHGRKVAWVAVLGFLCVLLAFLGVHLLADSMHNFGFLVP